MRRSLTDTQRQQIADAARTLSTASRLAFLADVHSMIEARCSSYITISNGDVQRAIEEVLDAAPWPESVFLCDQQTGGFSMSNFDPAIAQRVRDERARAKLENDAVYEDGVDEDAIEDGVLKDGYSLIVPLFMADGSINPKLTFAQRLMAEKAQKVQKAAMDAAASTTTGGPTMTKRNYTTADAQRFGLKDASALSRPGFRYNGADPYARDAAIVALYEYDREMSSAWEGNPPVGFGSHGPQGEKEGDACMTNSGSRGRKIDIGGRLVCVEDPHASDYLRESIVEPTDGTSLSDRELAHEEYIRDLELAWRNPTADVLDSDHVPVRGAGVDTRDASTVARDHQETMNQLYAQLDRELSEK